MVMDDSAMHRRPDALDGILAATEAIAFDMVSDAERPGCWPAWTERRF